MMIRPLSRRLVLRGAGGVAVGLPLLEAMLPRRAHAAASPRRFITFFTPNGTNDYKAFMPQTTGTNFSLGMETDPLLPLKDKLLVLSNINARSAAQQMDGDQHGVGMAHMLTNTPTAAGPKVDDVATWGGGVSIDQKIAQSLAAPTKFPSLELGVQTNIGTKGMGAHPFSRMVYKDRLQPVPSQDDPRESWKRLFSDLPGTAVGGGGAPAIDQAREQRRSILDFVRGDYQRVATKLGARDKQKIEAHLTVVRDIETRLSTPTAVAVGCRRPPEVAASINPSDPKQYPDIGKLQMDLLVLALACDLTRVASLQWSWARSDVAMTWIGVRDSHHEMTHGKASPTLSSVNRWYAEQVAYFATAMKAFAETDGSLLDNSVVWWCSDISFGPTHGFSNIRAFLLGGCGGHFKTGQHVSFTGNTATANQLMVTFMRAMGIAGAAQFGDPAVAQGPLTGVS